VFHDAEFPGVVDHSTLPELSTATQSEVVGQEIPFSCVVPSIADSIVHGWTVGVVLEYASPCLSVATQKVAEGHETAVRLGSLSGSTIPAGMPHAPVAGAVVESTSPWSSTATHSDADWQLTAVIPSVPGELESDPTGACQASGACACATLAPSAQAPQIAAARANPARRARRRMLVVLVMVPPASLRPKPVPGAIGAAKASSRPNRG
jgi:hypothetical protein